MERRSFLKLLCGVVAAIATGAKAYETPDNPIFTQASITKNKGDTITFRRVTHFGVGFEDVQIKTYGKCISPGDVDEYAKILGERMALTREMIAYGALKGKI